MLLSDWTWPMTNNLHPRAVNMTNHHHSREITWPTGMWLNITSNFHPPNNLTNDQSPSSMWIKPNRSLLSTWIYLTNHLYHLKLLDQSPSPLETTRPITFITWNNLTNHLHHLKQLDQSPSLLGTTWPINFTAWNILIIDQSPESKLWLLPPGQGPSWSPPVIT